MLLSILMVGYGPTGFSMRQSCWARSPEHGRTHLCRQSCQEPIGSHATASLLPGFLSHVHVGGTTGDHAQKQYANAHVENE